MGEKAHVWIIEQLRDDGLWYRTSSYPCDLRASALERARELKEYYAVLNPKYRVIKYIRSQP